ncbi:hypothetical protein D3C87_1822470 [compost metagenome]
MVAVWFDNANVAKPSFGKTSQVIRLLGLLAVGLAMMIISFDRCIISFPAAVVKSTVTV